MILTIWIICAIVCYNVADDKGYNKWNGLFAGIFFGVIAVVYYLTIKRKTD